MGSYMDAGFCELAIAFLGQDSIDLERVARGSLLGFQEVP